MVGVGVGVVGVGVGVGVVGVGVGVGVGVFECVGVGVGVGFFECVGVGVGVGVSRLVGVGVSPSWPGDGLCEWRLWWPFWVTGALADALDWAGVGVPLPAATVGLEPTADADVS